MKLAISTLFIATFFILLPSFKNFQFASLVVTSNSNIINTLTTYQISYDRTQNDTFNPTAYNSIAILPTDTVTVTFPTAYTLTTVTCTVSVNGGTQTTPSSCTVSGKIVIATGVVNTNTFISTLVLYINNILNPSPAITTDYFYGTIGSDVSGTGTYASTVVLQPGSFQSCYITFSPNIVNSTSAMMLTIVPRNTIGSSGSIFIQFPASRRWTNDISNTNYMPITSSMSCSNQSSNVQSTFLCTGNIAQGSMTASGLFSSAISSSFSFSINNFLSPPTGQPSDPITITSYINGSAIDTCTAYVSNLAPKPITSISIVSSTGVSIIVNRQYLLKFSFTISDTVAQTDTMTITFPTPSAMAFSNINLSSNFSILTPNATYDISSGILYLVMQNLNRTFPGGTVLVLTVGTYTAPSTIQPTSNFIINIFRNGYIKMQGTTTLSASASTITGTASLTATAVNANTSYSFNITTSDTILSSGKIKIIIPPTITILASSASCANVSGTNMANIPVCTYNLVQNSISLTNINSSSASITPTTMIIIINGLKNPSSIAPTSNFTISTYNTNSDSSLVAIGSIAGIAATTAGIDSSRVTVIASSYVVNDQAVTYTIELNVVNPIPVGGFFMIYLPPDISLPIASVSALCQININSTSFVSTPCVGSNNGTGIFVNFTNPFASPATSGTIFIARLSNVVSNPSSTKPTATLGLYTYDSSGYSIASLENSMIVQMVTPDGFSSISISRASQKNYETTSYTFTIQQRSLMIPNSTLTIGFPSNVVPSIGSACSISAPISSSLTCTYSNPTISVTLPSSSSILANTTFTIAITNIRNPASYAPTGTFTFSTKLPGLSYTYSNGTYSPNLMNSVSTSFQSLTFQFTPATYSTAVTLQLSFQPSNSGTLPSSMKLTFANSFIINTVSCSSFVNFAGTCNMIYANTLQINGTFSSSLMSFSVTGITSPTNAPSDYSSLVSFDSLSYQLDSSTNSILFAIICTMPCKTCVSPTFPATCTSCYSSTTITQAIYFDSVTSNCYQNCPDGRFANTTSLLCQSCDSNCLTCTSTAAYCLSCYSNSTFKYIYKDTTAGTQVCVSQCPSTMYPETSMNPITCKQCVSPCKNCTTSSLCLSCLDGFYFYQNQCLASCPTDITINNTSTNNCDFCDSNCLTCKGITSNCTSCNQSLLLYQGLCRTSCPTPLVPQNGTCGPCDNTCLTCVNDPYTCTSCDTSSSLPFLYGNLCLSICPQLYYQNIANGTCLACSAISPTIHCNNCSSATTCLSCNTGYVLYLQQCLNYTPAGYVNISGVAQPCTGDCATCEGIQSNCTSCKTNNLNINQCTATCPAGTVAISKVCQLCLSPCKTCQTTTSTCSSCLINLTPPAYLTNGQCLQLCPDGTYPTQINHTCQLCMSPCEYCTTLAQCTTCLDGFFFMNGSCPNTCQPGYVGLDRVCQACISSCATCQNSTVTCTSCVANTYLFAANSSCLSSCGTGLYIDYLNRKCVYCSPPCKTCVSTADTCLSCVTGYLFNNQCLTQCPDKYFPQTGQCYQCPLNCSSCASLNNCTTCADTLVQYNGFCITQCPATHAVVVNSVCTKCSTQNCYRCTPADYCISCLTNYSLYNGACLSQCPSGFKTNGTHCQDIVVQSLTSSSSFPVPFSIATVIVIIACLMSKLQFSHTFMSGAIFSLLGLIEWGALGYFLYLYFKSFFFSTPTPFIVGVAAMGYLYIMNILAVFIQNFFLCNDKSFKSWLKSGANRFVTVLVNIIATLANHKFRNLIFCKLFNFDIFTAQLDSLSKFKVINIFSFLSIFHSGAAIYSASAAINSATLMSQLYFACIDVIVITSINVIMAFFNVLKEKDHFYERTPDGFQLKKRMNGDDYYFQSKIQPAGKGNEDEEGYASNILRMQAGTGFTSKPFTKDSQVIFDKDFSYGSLMDKNVQEISVQAQQHANSPIKNNSASKELKNKEGQTDMEQFMLQTPEGDERVGQHLKNQSQIGQDKPFSEEIPSQIKSGDILLHQKIYNKDMVLHERQKSPSRTIFYKQKMASVVSLSQLKNKRSIYDSSGIEEGNTEENKNILYKPNLSPKKRNSAIEYRQGEVEVEEKKKDVAVGRMRPIQFEEQQEDRKLEQKKLEMEKQAPTNVVFQQSPPTKQKQSAQKSQLNLDQSIKDQLLLPQEQIEQYERELKEKMKEKDLQINKMKEKIQQKQQSNNLLKNKDEDQEIVEAGKIYRKGVPIKGNLESQEEANDESTIKQDIYQNIYEGNKQNSKRSQQNDEENIEDMVQDQENLIYQQGDQNNQQQEIQQNIKLNLFENRPRLLQPQQQQVYQKQYQPQEYASSEQDISTKIQSSKHYRNRNRNGGETDGTLINVDEIEMDRTSNDTEGIHDRPLGPDLNNIRTDLSDALQSGLERNMVVNRKNKQAGQYSQRLGKNMKSVEKNQGRYDREGGRKQQVKSSAPIKPQTALEGSRRQHLNKEEKLKTINRFEFQNSQKNISQSGQDQIPFNSYYKAHHMMAPFETDKEETTFNQKKSPQKIMIPRQYSTIPASRPSTTIQSRNLAVSPNRRNDGSMQKKGTKSKAQFENEFGPPERDDQPLQQVSSQYISKPKRKNRMNEQRAKPENDELKKYYEQSGRNSRQKSKKKTLQGQTKQTSKIYLQRQDISKQWK